MSETVFKKRYTSSQLRLIAARVGLREGWDFSRMNTAHPPTPWDYTAVVRSLLRPTDSVIDIGAGGGERLLELRANARSLLGVDPDDQMIRRARTNSAAVGAVNVRFEVGTGRDVEGPFDLVINRHAPFEPHIVHRLLGPGGQFVTQQVGEHNMANVKAAFHRATHDEPTIQPGVFIEAGFTIQRFTEYNVDYVIRDIESLIFWLQALDIAHSDFDGFDPERDVDHINELLSSSMAAEGLVTNEHRYLLVATRTT
ncbi:MAG: class I SAM-dependent methyltransferase [Acidimicrobiales bacterium]